MTPPPDPPRPPVDTPAQPRPADRPAPDLAARPPAERVAAHAPLAAPGHFDELRGCTSAPDTAQPNPKEIKENPSLTSSWTDFFEHLGNVGLSELDHRKALLQRKIRDNGVSYNVYADAANPQRPWSLDLFPLIVSPESWQQIQTGVLQRVRLLEGLMADVYGPQQLVARGLLPQALVQGHPGYLRALHGVAPVGGTHLHIAAFDLARGPDGLWWLVSQRTQAPSGLGYLLENRLTVSRLFPEAFEAMQVQRLAATYRALVQNLKRLSPAGEDAHIALLTPGPYNDTYFEHAYLARYLGLTLVEGSDLTVRNQRLYLKTLKGLQPVHGLLRRLDDAFLDPLELRADSTLGVPGLLQAMRAGHVLVANAPGAAFLESSALLGFLPALAEELLGETLQLPALPTWWCGERAALEEALPRLADSVVRSTYGATASHGGFDTVVGRSLSRRELDELAGRLLRQGDQHTVQAYLPLSQMPTWQSPPTGLALRSVMLRVFAIADGPGSWRVLPGGLARIASADADIALMQRGGSSADVWVRTHGEVDRTSLLPGTPAAQQVATHRERLVTSRAGENLFWLGRYSERAENTARLARLALDSLNGEHQASQPLLAWLSSLAVTHNLVLPDVPSASQARRVFERSLVASLADTRHATSVGYNLRALRLAASGVRERLSQDHWNVIVQLEDDFFARCRALPSAAHSPEDALRVLEATNAGLATITGAQADRMTRDDGWRLLSLGRQIERLGFFASALAAGFETGSVHDHGGHETMLALFDSAITFHGQYQQRRDIGALLDLLVLSRENPRSLGWITQTLQGRLAKLCANTPDTLPAPVLQLDDPATWSLDALCTLDADGRPGALRALLAQCSDSAAALSNALSARFFTHSGEAGRSLGV